jgi:hypothetical protein
LKYRSVPTKPAFAGWGDRLLARAPVEMKAALNVTSLRLSTAARWKLASVESHPDHPPAGFVFQSQDGTYGGTLEGVGKLLPTVPSEITAAVPIPHPWQGDLSSLHCEFAHQGWRRGDL